MFSLFQALILLRKPDWLKELKDDSIRKIYSETEESSRTSMDKFKGFPQKLFFDFLQDRFLLQFPNIIFL